MTREPLRTADEVAARLRKPRAAVVALARGGGIRAVRDGRRWLFEDADVDAWIEEHKTYTAADGEATDTRQWGRVDVPRPRSKASVGRLHRRGMDAGGPSDPAGALRIVRAGG